MQRLAGRAVCPYYHRRQKPPFPVVSFLLHLGRCSPRNRRGRLSQSLSPQVCCRWVTCIGRRSSGVKRKFLFSTIYLEVVVL